MLRSVTVITEDSDSFNACSIQAGATISYELRMCIILDRYFNGRYRNGLSCTYMG